MNYYQFGNHHQVAEILGVKPRTVRTYQKFWLDKIHYYQNPPYTDRAGFTYNLTLIQHWVQCGRDRNHPSHIQEILAYQQTLSPKKRKLMAV